MKVPCKLRFVTLSNERTESYHQGFVEISSSGAYIEYEADDHAMRLELTQDDAHIQRRGKDEYTLLLREGHVHSLCLGQLCAEVRTEKLQLALHADRVNFMARYTLGGQPVTVIVKAVF